MAQHALLSASSASRWMSCTPSAIAESAYPDKGSEFAREGTLAHAIAALKLKRVMDMDTDAEEKEIAELSPLYHTGEMEEFTDGYVEFVLDRWRDARQDSGISDLLVERRLDFSCYVPEGFGTGDAVIVTDGTLEIIDLKYGKGVKVSAIDNPQMRLYALGAIDFYDYAYNIDTIRMTIYQPRLANISTEEMPVSELRKWAEEELAPLAMLASKGRGTRKPGDHCRFCKAAADCTALARKSLETFYLGEGDYLTPDVMAREVLPKIPMLQSWIDRVKEASLERALRGEEFPGWKVVAGRSTRKITDPTQLVVRLTAEGFESGHLFRPQELRTLTDLEKIVGKKRFAEVCGDCVEKKPGKPTLVPETDKRESLDPKNDFNFISETNQ